MTVLLVVLVLTLFVLGGVLGALAYGVNLLLRLAWHRVVPRRDGRSAGPPVRTARHPRVTEPHGAR